jgi:hypothetical protein
LNLGNDTEGYDNTVFTTLKTGDNPLLEEINVENISEDYDVEQLADKIKSMIYEDSIYRNVNTINLIR